MNVRATRELLAEVVFWLHFVIGGFWYAMVFIPIPGWEERVQVQFYVTLVIVLHQFVWGAMLLPWTKHYSMVCVLTTVMEWIRGEHVASERNYRHSWAKEFFARVGWGLPQRGATIMTFVVLVLSALQFVFLK